MSNLDPLSRTKLSLPFIRPSLVSRQQLHEKIMQGMRRPPTLIIAPAGKQDWTELREEARQNIFRRLKSIGIADIE